MPKSADFWEARLRVVTQAILVIERDLARVPGRSPASVFQKLRRPVIRMRWDVWVGTRIAWKNRVRHKAKLRRKLAALQRRLAYIQERLEPKSAWELLVGKPLV
jgi:hypothetical protein